jgi:hypothetical protein
MSPETCNRCKDIIKEVSADHPEWGLRDRLRCAEETMKHVRSVSHCSELECAPLKKVRSMVEKLDNHQVPVPSYLAQAEEVVELHILDQLNGHPDKFTAYSADKRCHCLSCQRNYKEWVKLYG